ncbi:hypothetical protein [Streptococcus oricebi]|uniref:Uncharacterized protein n=1 Tax=Streptococcus oricebi TaxID=1547447 RepID=A0ABS5B3Z7_9STRE|nr:hypothetical protein [Streptococcus oricebi]MBP2623551.1 hypothetical protein [Streptococcus oricebi]
MIYILWLLIPLVLLLLIVPNFYVPKKKRKWLFLIYLLVFGWGAYYIFYQSDQPDILQPGQSVEIEIRPNTEGLEPITELYIDNLDGGQLLLTGRDSWHEKEHDLQFNIKEKEVSYWDSQAGYRKILNDNHSHGITLTNKGIIIDKKRKYTFSTTENKTYKVRIKNLSNKKIHYNAFEVFR